MARQKRWTLLTIAPDQLTAEMWQEILKEQGIPTMLSPEDAVSFLGISALPCRIMVSPHQLEQARQLLESLKMEKQG